MRLHRTVYVQRERSALADGIKFGLGCALFALAALGVLVAFALLGGR